MVCTIKTPLNNSSDTLWSVLWEAACNSGVEVALLAGMARRTAQGRIPRLPPAAAQMLVASLAATDPQGLQSALMHMPIDCLDLHQVCYHIYIK